MRRWTHRLRAQSYSRRFIWKSAIAILLGGMALGLIAQLLFQNRGRSASQNLFLDLSNPESQYFINANRPSNQLPDALIEFFETPGLDVESLLEIDSLIEPYLRGANRERLEQLIGSAFGEPLGPLLVRYFGALGEPGGASRQALEAAAAQEPPPRYANRLLGQLETKARRYHLAHPYFKREGHFPDAEIARVLAIETLRYDKQFDELSALLQEPGYQTHVTPFLRLELTKHRRDWLGVALALPAYLFFQFDWRMAVIAGIAAFVWASLLLRLGQIDSWLSRPGGLCGLAFLAGAASVLPTLFLVILQDAYVGYDPHGDDDIVRIAAYFIGGVGLREEFCKLLLFLPFALRLARKGSELDALIVASFVGLGFAAAENVSYFDRSAAIAAPARFLTANFFHIALTGMGGLYLCRALRNRDWNEFLYLFGIMIVVHGLYDTLLSLPGFPEGAFFAMIVFILLSMYYFRELNALNAHGRPAYSLSFLFVCGLCLIIASVIIYQSSQIGLFTSLRIVIPETLGVILIVFMFFREFNEALGD